MRTSSAGLPIRSALRLHTLGTLLALTALGAAPIPEATPQAKIEPAVRQAALAASGGLTDFLIVLDETADLTPAFRLLTKEEKGRYVFATLTERARRSQTALRDVLRAAGCEYRPFWIVNAVWARGDLRLIEGLAARADVREIRANLLSRLSFPAPAPAAADATLEGVEWNISKVRAPEVWALGYTGAGVVIGGQDTGYDWRHPALRHHYRGWNGTMATHDYNWHDAIHEEGSSCGPDTREPCDDNGHGTHTMGIMVGDDGTNSIGMAPDAQWIGCRNMNAGWGSLATYLECFEWFVAPTDLNGTHPDPSRAPDVMNNSWVFVPEEGCTNPNLLRASVEAARAAGIVVVASAGNTGPAPGSLRDPPAIYAAALTVGSVDSGDTIADSSARGPVTVDGSGRLKPDVTAPGVNIRSAVPGGGYGYGSGTSMAGPHVAGLAALILSAHPGLRGQVDRVEILITRTAVPRLDVPNNTYGWGRIDALAAVGLGDSDHDGIPNWWELIFGLNPTNAADAAEDVDADGFTALQEYAANTDPTNTTSALRITDLTVSTAGVVQVTWYSRPDGFGDTPRRYQVLRSARLPGDSEDWSPVATNVAAAGETTSITDCLGPAPPARLYYRVETVGAEGMATCATAPRGVRVRDTPVLFVIQ